MLDSIQSESKTVAIESGDTDRSGRRALDLIGIQQHFQQVIATQTSRDEALAEFTLAAAELTSAEFAAYYWLDNSQTLTCGPRVSIAQDKESDTIAKQVEQLADEAAKGKPVVRRIAEGNTVVAVPVVNGDGQWEVMAVALRLDEAAEPFVVTLQMIAAHVTLWYQQQSRAQLDWEADAMAALVVLISEVENCDNQKAACLATAGKLNKFMGCQFVAIGIRSGCGQRISLRAISDKPEFDPFGETAQLLEDVMNESVIRESTTMWPPVAKDRHATLAHRRMAEQLHLANIVTVPLLGADDELVGGLTVANSAPGQVARNKTFVESSGPYIASALSTSGRVQNAFMRRAARWLAGTSGKRRLKIAASIALAVAVILAIPLPHKISCKCKLEPLSRRFAVAPYNGVLQEAFVKPGDLIEPNQLLARMDDRESTWELSGFLAERNQAAKKRDTSLSAHDVPAAQMAQLEVDRLELKIRLLRHQQENLEIRSNVKGIVVDGDLEDAKGAPVQIGESLFEIAALDRLRLEVAVPEENLPYVAEGMTVTVKLDGYGGGSVEGTIRRLRPRAEIRNNDNVFIAEVEIENSDGSLRPGMNGRAKVVSQRRMLGWILFHRAYEKLMSFFG